MHSADRIAGCDQSAVNMYEVSVLVPVMTVIGTVLLAYWGGSSGGGVDLGGGLEAVPSHCAHGFDQEVTAEGRCTGADASGVGAVVSMVTPEHAARLGRTSGAEQHHPVQFQGSQLHPLCRTTV